MEPTSPTDDFRLSIDWGDADDEGFLAAATAPPLARPAQRRSLAGDAPEEPVPDHAPASPAAPDVEVAAVASPAFDGGAASETYEEPAWPDDAPVPASGATPAEPDDFASPAMVVDASLEGIASQVQSSAVRIEALHGESSKLRAATDRRLAEVAAQLAETVDGMSDLRLALARTGDSAARLERLERSVEELGDRLAAVIEDRLEAATSAGDRLAALIEGRLDAVTDAVVGAEARQVERDAALEAFQAGLEERVNDVVAATGRALEERLAATDEQVRAALQAEFELLVSRLRSAVDQAEIGLRDTYDAGRREAALAREEARTLLADVANELRLVKRRLALRAKPPVAELSDEQLAMIVRTVRNAVVETIEPEQPALPAVVEAASSPVADAPRRRRRGTA